MGENGTDRMEAESADDAFDAIDARMAELTEVLEGCRRAMLLARVAVLGGGLVLAYLLLAGTAYRNVGLVLLALASTFGGIVWYGASRTSREQTTGALADLAAEKDDLIDTIARRNGWRELTDTVH